jgi:hypothetical protein
MVLVRPLLIAVLVLRAAGVPVAAEAPCAAAAVRGEVCCMRHATQTGGDVIGHCACQPASEPLEQSASVSTPAPPHVSGDAVLSVAPAVEMVPSPESEASGIPTRAGGPIHSPPRLTGSGFRC